LQGFGARGEGTLTSQLIVLKNVNIEMQNYTTHIVDLYEQIKLRNKSTIDPEYFRPHNETIVMEKPSENEDDGGGVGNEYDEYTDDADDADYKPDVIEDFTTTTIAGNHGDSIETNQTKIEYTHFTYAEIMSSKIFENLTGSYIYRLLPDQYIDDSNQAYNSISQCDYSLNIGNLHLSNTFQTLWILHIFFFR
jgi:hypothetical protein